MCVGVSGNLEQPFNTLNFRLYFWSGRRLAFLGQSEILRGIGSGLPTGLSLVTNGHSPEPDWEAPLVAEPLTGVAENQSRLAIKIHLGKLQGNSKAMQIEVTP